MRVFKKKTFEERLGDLAARLRSSSALPERERDFRVLRRAEVGGGRQREAAAEQSLEKWSPALERDSRVLLRWRG